VKFFKIGIGGKKLTKKELNSLSTHQSFLKMKDMIEEAIEDGRMEES
jgi:hypothetical protein